MCERVWIFEKKTREIACTRRRLGESFNLIRIKRYSRIFYIRLPKFMHSYYFFIRTMLAIKIHKIFSSEQYFDSVRQLLLCHNRVWGVHPTPYLHLSSYPSSMMQNQFYKRKNLTMDTKCWTFRFECFCTKAEHNPTHNHSTCCCCCCFFWIIHTFFRFSSHLCTLFLNFFA